MRMIPAAGINLFQLIYILIREYEEKTGQKCLNLSLGNPDLIPPKEVLERKARFDVRPDYDLHTYAEDKNLERFAEGMVEAFSGVRLEQYAHLRATPIAGIKTATAILPLACGLHLKGRENFRVVTHLPAYDVMGTWAGSYLGSNRIVWPLRSQDGMKMRVDLLRSALDEAAKKDPAAQKPDLVFVIRPGNPASAGATAGEWRELIDFCADRKIRLVNDGAYATLTETVSDPEKASHVTLASVAAKYGAKSPDFEWAELYSMSKSFSDPGQRLGVLVGTKEFVEDFTLIKGNTDSGPVPAGMAAYGDLLRDTALAKCLLQETYGIYRKRLDALVPLLKEIGLRPACETTSGFFTLWKTPDEAYSIDLVKEAAARGIPKAELFNRLTIEKTGIVGVHFTGPSTEAGKPGEAYIRYAVCTDVLSSEFQSRFREQIAKIQPKYSA